MAMREIKFRGREYDARYGRHWVYGDLTHKFVQVHDNPELLEVEA